jgi:hypothetical protein
MILRTIALGVILLVTACAAVPDPVVVCPVQVRSWTRTEQTEANSELLNLPPDSVLAEMLIDYDNMRQQASACQVSQHGVTHNDQP